MNISSYRNDTFGLSLDVFFRRLLLVLLLLPMTLALAAAPATISSEAINHLFASDGTTADHFGSSVSISGDTAIIGALSADPDNTSMIQGAAYIYVRGSDGNWTEQAKFIKSDSNSTTHRARFGVSVSISGDTAVIGEYRDSENGFESGAAYVVVRDSNGNWSERAKLMASDGSRGDGFGVSVSISGNTSVVGSAAGAYVFVRDSNGNWSEQAKLVGSNGAAGSSVSISGSTVVVGSGGKRLAYVFTKDSNGSWSEQAKLITSTGQEHDAFGGSVSISIPEDTVVIGASVDIDNGLNSGVAYVFIKDSNGNWSEQAKLIASDARAGLSFGRSVSISEGTAVIGAKGGNVAYTFVRDSNGNWSEQAKLIASDISDNNGGSFGSSVSISGDIAIIGAKTKNNNTGAAYGFVLNSLPPNSDAPLCETGADPQTINNGEGTAVWWWSQGALSGKMTNIGNITVPSDYKWLHPTETTTYKMIVIGENNVSAICETTVIVKPSSPTAACSMGADPQIIKSGEGTAVWWWTEDAVSASITRIGAVRLPSNYKWIYPYKTTKYTLNVMGNDGVNVSCETTVTVQ